MTTTPPDLYTTSPDIDGDSPLDGLTAATPSDLWTWAVRHSRWRTDYEEAE